jgi:hypothetical protein
MADVTSTAPHRVAGVEPYKEYTGDEEKKAYNSSSDGLADDSSSNQEAQGGVKAMEAISVSWTKWSIITAYIA